LNLTYCPNFGGMINLTYSFYCNTKSLIRIKVIEPEINPTNANHDIFFRYQKNSIFSIPIATNLFEIANNEIYFGEHLPSLTDIKISNDDYTEVSKLLKFYKSKIIKISNQ